jgi:hypothetical protein
MTQTFITTFLLPAFVLLPGPFMNPSVVVLTGEFVGREPELLFGRGEP